MDFAPWEIWYTMASALKIEELLRCTRMNDVLLLVKRELIEIGESRSL
jgi:hypothetical protein